MTADKPDVAGIAGRLSEAQRASFLRDTADPKWSPPMWIRAWNPDLVAYVENPWGDFLVWTPRGLALRQHLMEKNDVQG